MKDTLKALCVWFIFVFFGVLLTVLGFKMAMLVVNNIMGAIA